MGMAKIIRSVAPTAAGTLIQFKMSAMTECENFGESKFNAYFKRNIHLQVVFWVMIPPKMGPNSNERE